MTAAAAINAAGAAAAITTAAIMVNLNHVVTTSIGRSGTSNSSGSHWIQQPKLQCLLHQQLLSDSIGFRVRFAKPACIRQWRSFQLSVQGIKGCAEGPLPKSRPGIITGPQQVRVAEVYFHRL
jgi:hypothetical protein